MNYEPVIGLEVHVQIKTHTKMFSRVATGFGLAPNELTDPVVLALPGALPVINKAALDGVIKAGLIFDCEIASVCKWDRKNYFYPDSPKNYQISQYDQPICRKGKVLIQLPGPSLAVAGPTREVQLTRIHLEEDVGKLNHGTSDSLVDYNRAGTPLMEIVSEPDMHSADEAFAFLTALRRELVNAGISDCDMEKGQMRCDANISIRPDSSSKLGTKVELKNLNSISYVREGIIQEIKRQNAVVAAGGTIVQETRLFDGETGRSASMRSKEEAHDYRYFPDPDLMPVRIDEAWKERLRSELPPKAFVKKSEFEDYGVQYATTSVLVSEPNLLKLYDLALENIRQWQTSPSSPYSEYVKPVPISSVAFPISPAVPFWAIPASGQANVNLAQVTGNLAVNLLQRELHEIGKTLDDSPINPAQLAGFSMISASGVYSAGDTQALFHEMITSGKGKQPEIVAIEMNLTKMSTNSSELEEWCHAAIMSDPKSVEQVKSGNEKAINALKGAVMKASKGKANPKLVDETLRKLLAAM